MRVTIEVDENLGEESVVIRCRTLDDRILRIQQAISEQTTKDLTILLHKNENEYSGFIMFIFDEILAEAKDKNLLCESYEKLLKDFNLPYAFFPYFLHFNKVLPNLISFPNPKLKINTKNGSFNVVIQPCFGMLVLNLNLIKDFKFDEQFGTSFYVQDLIHYCKEKDLYFSKSFFMDVCDSYKLFNSSF